MPRHTGPVLVDTNIILECHGADLWRALVGGYRIETVHACLKETQAGAYKRPEEQRVDEGRLVASLHTVHQVSEDEISHLGTRTRGIPLDAGEEALWAHAVGREDDWILCGPDAASLRAGIHLGFRERLVSLESLLKRVGHRPKGLRRQYTESWHRDRMNKLVIAATLTR